MSALDQPILFANANYHIGHQMSLRAAEEQGFFREEGLAEYVYEASGLVPGPFERDGLPLVLQERGVDIAAAVNVETIVYQRARGTDLYVVGAWRHMPQVALYAAPGIKTLADLRGKRIGQRESGGITATFYEYALRKAGVDATREIEWVEDPVFAYRRDTAHVEMLLSGKVDAAQSAPPFSEQLEQKGYHLLLDSTAFYGGVRPGKVIVASSRTIEQRGDELRAFLRAAIRGFWFVRDRANFATCQDLERRLRQASHNEDERKLRMVTDPDAVEEWIMPLQGGFARNAVEGVIDEMVTLGQLDRPIAVEEVVRDGPVNDAYRDITTRPQLRVAAQKAAALVEKYGY